MKLTPENIISAFDEILDFIYGRSYGRDYPAKEDVKYAQSWIDEGVTLPIASCVFYRHMSRMHEFWLKQIDHKDKKNIPSTLKFFDEYMLSAIRRVIAGGEPIASWEQSEGQWRARINGFISKKLWNVEMWGPRPYEEGCRAPARLIEEAKKDRVI